MTLSYFPRLGQKEGSGASYSQQRGEIQRSQYLSDELIGAHPRYQALASSIFLRRGRKVAINVPIFQDKHSPRPFHDPTVNYNLHDWAEDDDVRNGAVKENHIYGDCFTIGSSTSLQVTVQGKNIDEARKLYDQLIPLGPIMLALTAATPFFKGYLTDVDTRWPQVEASMEDRTPAELGEKVRSQCPQSFNLLISPAACHQRIWLHQAPLVLQFHLYLPILFPSPRLPRPTPRR